jgi:polysaccharide biosynthesis protein PslH
MSRPGLLFLSQVLPFPLVGGAKIRAYYVLRRLAQDYDVTLVSFVRADDRFEDVQHLAAYCRDVYTVPVSRSRIRDAAAIITSALKGTPAVIARDWNRRMERTIAEVIAGGTISLVHADQTSMAQYGQVATRFAGGRVRTVLDAHNAMYRLIERQSVHYSGWRRRLWVREARLMARYEARLCLEFDQLLAVTEEDRVALLNLPGCGEADSHKVAVLPICVDAYEPPVERQHMTRRIIHVGTMFWPPNIDGVLWFAREIFPMILAQLPEAEFLVVGKNPPPEVVSLPESLPQAGKAVKVLGYAEEVEPLLAESGVFIVPVRAGGGMRVKIPKAWQWGIPIVSTTLGAEGIAVQPGQNILLADDAQAFARSVVRVLTDPELASSLRQNGRAWLAEHYHWSTQYDRLVEIYGRLLGEPSATASSGDNGRTTE